MDDDEQQKKLLEALRDDVDFQQKLTKLYEDHARNMVRIKSMPPPTEEQKQKIAEVIAEQRRWVDDTIKDRAEAEEKERLASQARESARQAHRENDPAYWKRLYLDMVEREKERKRQKEITQNIFIVSGVVGALLLLLKFIGWL